MDDARLAVQRARIVRLIDLWHTPLGLRFWKVQHVYYRELLPRVGAIRTVDGEIQDPVARCEADWRYFHATIRWACPLTEELTDDELEEIFVHECTHILVNEMRGDPDDWLDHEERVVSTLTKAFLWVRGAFAEAGPDLDYHGYDG